MASLYTHVDPREVDTHVLSELTLGLRGRLGVLLELALQNVDLVLSQPRLRLVGLLRVRHAHHGSWLPVVRHGRVPTHGLLRVVVVRDPVGDVVVGNVVVSEVLEVVVVGLLEVLHGDGASTGQRELEHDCACD